jgi:hypothetical protein
LGSWWLSFSWNRVAKLKWNETILVFIPPEMKSHLIQFSPQM